MVCAWLYWIAGSFLFAVYLVAAGTIANAGFRHEITLGRLAVLLPMLGSALSVGFTYSDTRWR